MHDYLYRELTEYLDDARQLGVTSATYKNKQAYCTGFLRTFSAAAATPRPRDVEKYARAMWLGMATERTIMCKVSEVISWCRWLESRKPITRKGTFEKITAADILEHLKEKHPLRR